MSGPRRAASRCKENERVRHAWSHSLEYSIGTSSHGVNVMNAICEQLGFVVDKVFRKIEEKSADEYREPQIALRM